LGQIIIILVDLYDQGLCEFPFFYPGSKAMTACSTRRHSGFDFAHGKSKVLPKANQNQDQ
jgi:hypothetical protein